MKTFRLSFYLFILLIGGMTLFSCSKDDPGEPGGATEEPGTENPEEPGEDEDIVLGKNTVTITPGLVEHVVAPVTDMQIVLDNAVKESDLPEAGQILLNMDQSETFPYGFLGKVSKVVRTDNGYTIEAEKVYLDEAFDKLYVKGEMEVVLPDDSRANKWTVDVSNYTDGDYKGVSFGLTVSNLRNCSKDSYVGITLGIGFVFEYIVDINNQIKKPYASFSLKKKFSVTPQWHIEYSRKSNSELYKTRLGSLELFPKLGATGIANCIFHPQLVFSYVVEASGTVSIDTDMNFVSEGVTGLMYKDRNWELGSRCIKDNELTTQSAKFSLDGSVFSGLECALEARLFSEKIASLSIPFKIGGKVSAKVSSEVVASTDYETLSDLEVTFGVPNLSAEASVDLFADENPIDIVFPEVNLLEKKLHLFPAFEDMNAERSADNKTRAEVSAEVKQDLLMPVTVDYRLYDEEGVRLPVEQQWVSYFKEKDMAYPLQKTLTGLSPSKKYLVSPVVKLPVFGEIPAKPVVEIEAEEIEVMTEGHYFNDVSLTFIGSFAPELLADHSITEYGICYDTAGNPTLNSMTLVAGGHEAGQFQATIIAENDVTYYYRAYMFADGVLYYGDIRQAKLQKDDLLVGEWELVDYKEVGDLSGGHGWCYGDLTLTENGTFTTTLESFSPTSGHWFRVESPYPNSFLIQYDSDGEELGLGFIIQELTETTLCIYSFTSESEEGQTFFGVYLYYVRK